MSKEQNALEYLKSKIDIDKKYYNYDKAVETLEQALEDYEIYKKAFENAITKLVIEDDHNEYRTCGNKDFEKLSKEYLDQARKELSNERQYHS